jgi:hypothetical protein
LIDIYCLEKNPAAPLYFLKYFVSYISFYIFDNTLILTRPPLNIATRQLKKSSRIELISTVGSLHVGHFLLRTSPFSTGRTGRIVYRKKPPN